MVILLTCCDHDFHTFDRTELVIHDSHFQGKVTFQKLTSRNGFKLILKNNSDETLDQTIFQYVAYQLDTGDIDRDGRTEVLVGLIKATTFDSTERKRLFILRIDDGQLRPLWLGSRVCQELVNFKVIKNGIVQTFEKDKNGSYTLGLYTWQGFGLALKKYTHHELSFTEAQKIFNNNI